MASRPPIECPLCHETLEPGNDVEGHLVGSHSKTELARHIVSEVELWIEGDVSD